MANILLDRFVRAVPKQFVARLLERQQSIYLQSIELAFNESWSRVEATNVLPHIRRGLMESEFRKAGLECALKVFDMPHAGDNCSCVMVKADGLILTEHYVDGPGQFVRDAKSRKQNIAVNSWLDEYADENLLIHPLPKLGRKPIYLNVLHGSPHSNRDSDIPIVDASNCFFRIAIPEEGTSKYLYNWSAQEILLAYATAGDAAVAPLTVEDNARPRRKAQLVKLKKIAMGSSE